MCIRDRQYAILNDTLFPALAKHNINFIRRRFWTTKLKTWVRRYFRDEIAPIITPIGLDPTHPFPLLVNKSLNFIVELEGIDAFGRDSGPVSYTHLDVYKRQHRTLFTWIAITAGCSLYGTGFLAPFRRNWTRSR